MPLAGCDLTGLVEPCGALTRKCFFLASATAETPGPLDPIIMPKTKPRESRSFVGVIHESLGRRSLTSLGTREGGVASGAPLDPDWSHEVTIGDICQLVARTQKLACGWAKAPLFSKAYLPGVIEISAWKSYCLGVFDVMDIGK
jgi:hypothetical protein